MLGILFEILFGIFFGIFFGILFGILIRICVEFFQIILAEEIRWPLNSSRILLASASLKIKEVDELYKRKCFFRRLFNIHSNICRP